MSASPGKPPLTSPPSLEQLLAYLDVTIPDLLALEGMDKLGTDPPPACITGSLVEALGNYRSDIDIIVLTDSGPRPGEHASERGGEMRWKDFAESIHYLGKRRVDFEFWSPAVLESVARDLVPPEDLPEGIHELSLDKLKLVHRIKIGLPILARDQFEDIRNRFPFDLLQKYLLRRALAEVDSIMEDVQGMIDEEELGTTLLRTNDLLNSAYAAYAHHLGETNPTRKWTRRLMSRHKADSRARKLLDEFWSHYFPPVNELLADKQKAFDHVKRAIVTAAYVVEWVQP
jgi:hypothetical protein